MKKVLIFPIIFLFFSCATMNAVKETPLTQEVVKVTTIGEISQMHKPSFILIPDVISLKMPDNADTPVSVDVINCKQETVAISVTTNTSLSWISLTPVFLLKPYEIKKVSFTLMPYNIKNKTSEGEFDIIFSSKDFVQNLNVKVSLIVSEQTKEVSKPEQSQKPSDMINENVSKPKEGPDRKLQVEKKEVAVKQAVFYYTVHIASFKTKEEALDHLTSLPRLEPKTSVVAYDLGKKGVWYRVLIGLYSTLAEASAVAAHFKNFFGLGYANAVRVEEEHFTKNVVSIK